MRTILGFALGSAPWPALEAAANDLGIELVVQPDAAPHLYRDGVLSGYDVPHGALELLARQTARRFGRPLAVALLRTDLVSARRLLTSATVLEIEADGAITRREETGFPTDLEEGFRAADLEPNGGWRDVAEKVTESCFGSLAGQLPRPRSDERHDPAFRMAHVELRLPARFHPPDDADLARVAPIAIAKAPPIAVRFLRDPPRVVVEQDGAHVIEGVVIAKPAREDADTPVRGFACIDVAITFRRLSDALDTKSAVEVILDAFRVSCFDVVDAPVSHLKVADEATISWSAGGSFKDAPIGADPHRWPRYFEVMARGVVNALVERELLQLEPGASSDALIAPMIELLETTRRRGTSSHVLARIESLPNVAELYADDETLLAVLAEAGRAAARAAYRS